MYVRRKRKKFYFPLYLIVCFLRHGKCDNYDTSIGVQIEVSKLMSHTSPFQSAWERGEINRSTKVNWALSAVAGLFQSVKLTIKFFSVCKNEKFIWIFCQHLLKLSEKVSLQVNILQTYLFLQVDLKIMKI